METGIISMPINEIELKDMPLSTRLSVIDDGIRKKYLTRLSEMQIAPIMDLPPLENDLISNVRLYHIKEMVYQKGESVTDKFTTVFNTLATYNASVFILIDSDGKTANYYLGVRNNESDESPKKRSTVTLGDTLKQTLIGHFPGVKIENEDRKKIKELSDKISSATNVASVSVVGNTKSEKDMSNEQFVQGLEKLSLAMSGRAFTGLIIADNQMPQSIHELREFYQELYSKLSPYQKVQISENESTSTSKTKSLKEMNGKQRAAMGASTAVSLAGVIGGAVLGGYSGAMVGGQITGQFNGFINSLAPNEQITTGSSTTTSSTYENKAITEMMSLLDQLLKKTNEYDSYGMWNVAGYFVSDDMSTAEIAASNYRSLMNGENTGREVSAVNSWRINNDAYLLEEFHTLTIYLSRYAHPQFVYYNDATVSAATLVHTEHSDFSATYHVNLQETEEGTASMAVTQDLLETWGISVDQLHQDALAADMNRDPMFCDMGNMMESMMFGAEPKNLLDGNPDQGAGMGMYCLTNGVKIDGAGLILQGNLMQQIGEIVGGDFYILPSSCHEVIVVPETVDIELKELSAMVQQINRTEVSREDRLSDHVQHYDRKEAVMENAEKRASRLEKEKAETKAAKKSIHERLGEKKQQSAAKKAEKAVEKAVKKDKGQEL